MKKLFSALAALLLFFAAGCGIGAVYVGMTDHNGPETEIDHPDLVELRADVGDAAFSEGETVLFVPWGSSESALKISGSEKPQSFTVGDDGTIYIFDTCNHKLKTYQNGKYVSAVDFSGADPGGAGAETKLASMAYIDGSIYGIDSVTGKTYRITGDKLEAFGGAMTGFDKIRSLPQSCISVYKGSSKKIFGINASMLYNSETSAASQNFLYRDKAGNTITANTEYGYPDGPLLLELKNSDGKTMKTVSFSTFSDTINADGSETRVSGPGLIGFDASGRAYLDIYMNEYGVAGDEKTIHGWNFYLARLDPRNGSFKIIKVPVDGEYAYLPKPTASGGMYDTITPDGCLYRAYVSNNVGVRIVKFGFD